jgi:hypothetical protein
MKNKKMILGIAIILVIGLTMIACNKSSGGGSSGGGGKSLNSPEALKEYLDSQPANSPDKPIKVSMAINDPMFKNVADVIKSAGKYVSLNITGNALTEIPKNAFYNTGKQEGCKTLVGLTLPESVTKIGGSAFMDCSNLTSVTIIGNDFTEIGENAFTSCRNLISVTFQHPGISFGSYGSQDPFSGSDLGNKYALGGVGTYTTTAPVDYKSKWEKQ